MLLSLIRRFNIIPCVIAVSLSALCLLVFPFKPVTSVQKVDNPQNCPYYITLQSLLANYPALASDSANLQFIKERLHNFHDDLDSAPSFVRSVYEHDYSEAIKNAHLVNASDILATAEAVYPVIDRFYLDARMFCINPLYDFASDGLGEGHRRIMRHNLAGLYYGMEPYKAIIGSDKAWVLGAAPGLWVNNQRLAFDTRYMTSFPLLNALYVLPEFDFKNLGAGAAPLPMSYYTVASLSNPVVRKVFDIGGIDIFTVKAKEATAHPIPDTQLLQTQVDKVFNTPGFVAFTNLNSYGLAYLANHITYADGDSIRQDEEKIRHYFLRRNEPETFTHITGKLYATLLHLQEKHDIILEANKGMDGEGNAGDVHIVNIAGERALFSTECLRKACQLVFNVAAAPGWHAYVNGMQVPIERANYAFLSAAVPQGKSTVWFIYTPGVQVFSDLLSLLSLIGIGSFAIRHFRNNAVT